MLLRILKEFDPGFAEVMLMLANSASTAEVYTRFDDLRFTDDGMIVTFLAHCGTHLHVHLDRVRQARFIFTVNQQDLPSYSFCLMDEKQQPVLQVYLRRSNQEESNQPRHGLFMAMRQKYGELIRLEA